MDCPRCKKSDISVTDSRDCSVDAIRRRRECNGCHLRFTTYERIEPLRLIVQKRNGTTEPYNRDKILRSLVIATQKRDIPMDTIEDITDRIEAKVMQEGEESIPTKTIGDYVIRELRRLDHVAYLRFASVYRSFDTLEAFEKELAKLVKQRDQR